MIEEITDIILKYAKVKRDYAEQIAKKVALNPSDYNYVYDVLLKHFPPVNASYIAYEVYMKCLEK